MLDEYTTWTKDEYTALAKLDPDAPHFAAIEKALEDYQRNQNQPPTSTCCKGINVGYTLQTNAKRSVLNLITRRPRVQFAPDPHMRTFHKEQEAIMVTYDSSADGHYISGNDRAKAGLPILRQSK